ncbi:SDR family oxidoreductase [Arthrobacter mobilis]|uniref:SDR family oxidoreductase n=1 Tax=Arthrobacter mobilis TaxID=2724944 RepID=A0A7X6HEF1_9MICC|nr:SDR family oxidoreductase [Arthrobacter mobilis]NKX54678.1 SDR family oxidoreductase [Arthrobacter mobilis]
MGTDPQSVPDASENAAANTETAVTGATGRLGGAVARLLSEAGVPVRLIVRDPARAPQLPGTTAAQAGYGDRQTAGAALQGIRTLFMVSADEAPDRLEQHFEFIDAAADAGVEHIVYTSFCGAGPDAVFTLARDHFATEEKLQASGLKYTLLRNNLYQDVLTDFAGPERIIRGPAGNGRAGFVAREDVARVAAKILAEPFAHAGFTYELTGPESLTMAEAAAIITEATGRPVSFLNETVEEAYASRARYQAPDWQVEAWVSTYTAIACGELDKVTNDVELLTGHRPLSLRELLDQRRGR